MTADEEARPIMAPQRSSTEKLVRRWRPWRFLPVAALSFLLLGAPSAFAISRATVLARAQSWVDLKVPYSQTKRFGGYRTDCSGFTSMVWQTSKPGYCTKTLHVVSSVIASSALLPGDALVKPGYHAMVFYGWVDASHTSFVAYEEVGPASAHIHDLASDIAFGYVPYRYRHITNGPPAWNAVSNPSFDLWVSRSPGPMWWVISPSQWGMDCARTTIVAKTGKSALGLINSSSKSSAVVAASQTDGVTAGEPYTLSAWADTDATSTVLQLQIQFVRADGSALLTTMTTGASWGVGPGALRQMSLTVTAPADAASATIAVRLLGGTDASGTAGTSAVVDDVQLYDSGPVTCALSLSKTTATRGGAVSVSGTVTAPIAAGTVRVYVYKPGKTTASVLADRPLVAGRWSVSYKPTLRGTYRFTARYLGYGPYGPLTSAAASLPVR
jgi:hypothetical protein